MSYEVRMPRLSQTTDEVRLLRWRVKEGDIVRKGDPLCEVETDKTTMDVECVTGGTVVRLLVDPDTTTTSDTPIALVRESDTEPIKATPLVKNLAKKRDIDLHGVSGTGPEGLITIHDIKTYEGNPRTSESSTAAPVPSESVSGNDRPLPPNQLIVAKNASRNKRDIPHYYLKTTVLVDGMQDFRTENRRNDGSKLGIDSFFIRAAAQSLKRFPGINAYVENERVVPYRAVNVGFAVAVGDDLFVPVVKDAAAKTVQQIDSEVSAYTAKAKANALEAGDISGGTFTISNLSAFGIDEFSAIINGRQSGILAIGRFRRILELDHRDRMAIRTACSVTGSFDHRLVNGAQAAGFMRAVRRIIEKECA